MHAYIGERARRGTSQYFYLIEAARPSRGHYDRQLAHEGGPQHNAARPDKAAPSGPDEPERVNALWVLLAGAARVATKAFDDRLKAAETAEARA